MNIAIDFDQTYTADPELWDFYIRLAKKRGHEVRIVTIRPSSCGSDILKIAEMLSIKCIFTEGRQKEMECKERGWPPDIWIDDTPVDIPCPAQLAAQLNGCFVNDEVGNMNGNHKNG